MAWAHQYGLQLCHVDHGEGALAPDTNDPTALLDPDDTPDRLGQVKEGTKLSPAVPCFDGPRLREREEDVTGERRRREQPKRTSVLTNAAREVVDINLTFAPDPCFVPNWIADRAPPPVLRLEAALQAADGTRRIVLHNQD
jgi:hypothetical protein